MSSTSTSSLNLRFPRTWPRTTDIVAAYTAIRGLTATPSQT